MEIYQGIKFEYKRAGSSFSYDHRLKILNHWAFLFSELGLAPVHTAGAYGNQSYRTGSSSFVISKTGMIPQNDINRDDFVQITSFDNTQGIFTIEGVESPSSECFLHNAIYEAMPQVKAILHGHSSLLCSHAKYFNIPVTTKFYDYGTPELANSALQLINSKTTFFILKNHGFVALGKDIETAGKLTLDYYMKLIKLLQNN